jgi:DNA-binding FadR family transcriptional regulator
LRLLEQEIDSVLKFLDLRKWLEALAAAQAAEHACEDNIAEIQAALKKLEMAASEEDREAWDAGDVAFHLAILRATQNSPTNQMLDAFQGVMWSSRRVRTLLLAASDLHSACDEHRAVADAIRAGKGELASHAMIQHIESIRKRVERLYEEAMMTRDRNSDQEQKEDGYATSRQEIKP